MDIKVIKNNHKLENLVSSRYGVVLKSKTPSTYVGLCPLHSESTPSFHVYSNEQKYHCFGCGAGGDIFDLIQAKEGINFSEASKMLGTSSIQASKEAIREQRERQIKEESIRLAKQQKVSEIATMQWKKASPVLHRGNAYLNIKNVEPEEGIRGEGFRKIVIPMMDCKSRIWNLQTIIYEGNVTCKKLFMSGGRTKGLFFPIGGQFTQKKKIIIAEGIATALTIYQKTGGAFKVLCAFNASNIVNVAKEVRAKRPNYEIVIAADNDKYKVDEEGNIVEKDPKDNIGLIKANEAAKKYNCKVVYPKPPYKDYEDNFSEFTGSDFNDWYRHFSSYIDGEANKFISIFN